MARRFSLPYESRRPTDHRWALIVVILHAVALALLPTLTTRRPLAPAPRVAPVEPVRTTLVSFTIHQAQPEAARSASAGRAPALAPAPDVTDRGTQPAAALPAPSEPRDKPSERNERVHALRGILDQPFAPPPRDPRLLLPMASAGQPTSAGLQSLEDSLAVLRRAAGEPTGWVLNTESGTFGISRGALHFGRVFVPLPMFISLRDVNPQRRAERYMLQDVAEQAERARRDSVLSARRTP